MIERNDVPKQPLDAISMLKDDHQKVKGLFARFESARHFTTRQEVAEQVFAELETHAQLEENIFYPAYETQAGKQGTQLVAESRLEHENVKELMRELRHLDSADEEFETKFYKLMDDVEHHVEEEENEMFPEAEQILADQLEGLLDDMLALKAQVTTSER
jgi:iron-sulfur cluster repair protein YtfE (RIC family)